VLAVPARSRPSPEDRAALDEILHAKTGGPTVLDKSVAASAARPTPRPATRAAGASSTRRRERSRAPLLLGIAAALALAGVAAWFFILRPRGEGPDVRAEASTTPSAAPASVAVGRAIPDTPPASVSQTPAPASPSASPPASAAASITGARALLQGGRYPEAARLFAADMKAAGRSAATLQLLIACSSETVQKAVESVGSDELLIVPVQFQGRDCYRLCWGVYPSPARATAALRTLPGYFRERGATPRVMPAAEIAP